MPIVGIFILFAFTHLAFMPLENKRTILLIVFFSTVLLPISILPFLIYQRLIRSFKLPDRKERLLPMFITVIFYYFGYSLLRRLDAPDFIQQFLLATFFCVLVSSLVHLRWKISTHMVGLGGIIGLLSSLSAIFNINDSSFLMVVILVAGIVGSARIYLDAHSQSQVYSGFLIGFVFTFGVIFTMNIY